jgi:hypothetical protein
VPLPDNAFDALGVTLASNATPRVLAACHHVVQRTVGALPDEDRV